MPEPGVATEVADEAHVDDGVGELGPDHVLELLLAQIHHVDTDPPGVPFPVLLVDAANLVILQQPAGEQPPLAAGDPRDQHFFHCNSKHLADGNDSRTRATLH